MAGTTVEIAQEKAENRNGEPRGRTIRVVLEDRVFYFSLTPGGSLLVRERFARHSVTYFAQEIIKSHDRHKTGSLFSDAIREGRL